MFPEMYGGYTGETTDWAGYVADGVGYAGQALSIDERGELEKCARWRSENPPRGITWRIPWPP